MKKEKTETHNTILNELLFNGNLIRMVGSYSDLKFIAKDACDVLGLETRDLKKILDEDDVDTIHHVDNKGRRQEMLALSESGLYHLCFKSRKEVGQKFRRWVTREVLPQIRKRGFYVAQGMDPLLAQVAQGRLAKAEARELREQVAELEKRAQILLTLEGAMTVKEILEEYNKPSTGRDLLVAAGKMARWAKANNVPIGERKGTKTYPKADLINCFEFNQAEMFNR